MRLRPRMEFQTGGVLLPNGAERRTAPAIFVLSAAIVGSVALFLTSSQATESRTVQAGNTYLTLNGRTDAWQVAIGGPIDTLVPG